jgi:hypothetical protein
MYLLQIVCNDGQQLFYFPSDLCRKTTRRTLARGKSAGSKFPAGASHLWCTRSQCRHHSHRFRQRTCLNSRCLAKIEQCFTTNQHYEQIITTLDCFVRIQHSLHTRKTCEFQSKCATVITSHRPRLMDWIAYFTSARAIKFSEIHSYQEYKS